MGSVNQTLAKQRIKVTGQITISSTDGFTSRRINVPRHRGCVLEVNRVSETGTSTLDAKIQYLNTVAGTWDDLESAAIVQMGDGTTGLQYVTVYPGLTGSDADASIALNTVNKHCGAYLPDIIRVVLTTTGTTNVVSVDLILLP